MLETKPVVPFFHKATDHSYRSVQIDPNYVDASTQPSAYKIYPQFYRRYAIDSNHPIGSLIQLTSAITLEKAYRNWTAQLRAIPSAGGLYPTELYVQIRGVEGFINGLYHLEVATQTLTLVYELIDDGLEGYICPSKTVRGVIFLVSCVYFRSSWKYKNRSFRYCFLDSGHHLGAIEASAYLHEQDLQFIFDFDKISLNQDLGFENKEFVTACAIAGSLEDKPRRKFRLSIPFVAGTDYFEPSSFIEQAYRETLEPPSDRQPLLYPQFNFDRERFRSTIWNRRSARHFKRESISRTDFFDILQDATQAIASESYEAISIYAIVHRVEGMEPGVYRNNTLIKAGDFSQKAGYLCVEQAIAKDSAVTFFLTSTYKNYQTALQWAGLLGHRFYLASNYRGISCSGIGAYYDEETKAFLETKEDILYAIAIGI